MTVKHYSTYNATLTVTDFLGISAVGTLTINVNNIAPTVNAGDDQITVENQAITFNGSFTDPGILDTHTISWDFGDGSQRAIGENVNHQFANNGTYDENGNLLTDSSGKLILVDNAVTVALNYTTINANNNQYASLVPPLRDKIL